MNYTSLFPLAELGDAMIRKARVQDQKIIIVRQGDEVFALQDRCSHEDYALSEGFLEPGKICCSMHGAGFDLRSGAALSLPAYEPVKTYPIRVEQGMVQVAID